MNVLGIETSTPVSSVALGGEAGLIGSSTLARGRGHSEFLIPAVRLLCEQGGVPLTSLAGIGVGLGPGLFTGMRVGMATAKTLAQALGIPVVGIASLDLLAFQVRHSSRLICACIDAKRKEVFSALYRQVPGGVQRITGYRAWPPERLAAELEARGEEVLLIGDGALLYRSRLPSARAEIASVNNSFPTATALVELAIPRFAREDFDSLVDLEPLYVRKTDAEIAWEERGVQIARPHRVLFSPKATESREGNGRRHAEGKP